MPHGPGVSAKEVGPGRWRVRWRERNEDGSWVSREKTFRGTELERDAFVVKVRFALQEQGWFHPEMDEAARMPPANLVDGMFAMIAAREAAGRYRGNTSATYRSYLKRVAKHLYAISGIPDEAPLPVTLLSRTTFHRVQALDAEDDASQAVRYGSLRFLLDAWRWMADDPAAWHRVPTPPHAQKDYLPRTPRYGRTRAPTIEHMDAALRALDPKVPRTTRFAVIVMRYTGLRIGQVFAIRHEDIDLDELTLLVRAGKSEAERADMRTIPLSSRLLEEPGVLAWLERSNAGLVFPKKKILGKTAKGKRTDSPSSALGRAWEASEAPREVWNPPNRRHARPDHAFRAGVQAFLRNEGVDEDIIDFLVGHQGRSVRDVHYGRELEDKAREAVELMPGVRWEG